MPIAATNSSSERPERMVNIHRFTACHCNPPIPPASAWPRTPHAHPRRAHARAAPPLRAGKKIQNFFPLLPLKNRVCPRPVAPPVATRAARGGMVEGPCDDDDDERRTRGGDQ